VNERLHESDAAWFRLDLAVVDGSGGVLIVGEAKKTSKELELLLVAMRKHFDTNPGPPVGVRGAPQASWKLAYRLMGHPCAVALARRPFR